MEDIIDILLYDSFIELPRSNQTFEEKQGHFKLPRARQAGRNEHATYCVASEDLRKFKRESKGNCVTVSNRTIRKTFLLFCFRRSETVSPTFKLRFVSAMSRAHRPKA